MRGGIPLFGLTIGAEKYRYEINFGIRRPPVAVIQHNNQSKIGKNDRAELGEEVRPEGSGGGVLFYCFLRQ